MQPLQDGPDDRLGAAILGADHPGLRIAVEVAEGDPVGVGQVLFRDRKHLAIAFVSPIAGRVAAIRYAPRRMLSAVVLAPGDSAAPPPMVLPVHDDPRAAMLERGLWPAFVARPFGGCPDPAAMPDAIVVTALPASNTAPDPAAVLAGRVAAFRSGLEALTSLGAGAVHLCGPRDLVADPPPGVTPHRLRAPATPGALAWRVAPGRTVWTIGYQDVAAIGTLLTTGIYDPMRSVVVSSGAGSRLARLPLGADLGAVLPDEAAHRSGPVQHGRDSAFLGRHHLEAHALPRPRPVRRGPPAPIVPLAGLDRALPFGIPAVPLMRALAVGDVERCARLGCRDLLEEDVAPLTRRCTSGTDYGARLRDVLDEIQGRAA